MRAAIKEETNYANRLQAACTPFSVLAGAHYLISGDRAHRASSSKCRCGYSLVRDHGEMMCGRTLCAPDVSSLCFVFGKKHSLLLGTKEKKREWKIKPLLQNLKCLNNLPTTWPLRKLSHFNHACRYSKTICNGTSFNIYYCLCYQFFMFFKNKCNRKKQNLYYSYFYYVSLDLGAIWPVQAIH